MGRTKDSVWSPTEPIGPRRAEPITVLDPFAPRQRIGHYQILRKLGEGAMGQVYLAEDSNLDRRVALKVLKPEYRRHWSRLQRFKREAKAIAALSHPNIVTLFADESIDNIQFLVMEYVSGKKLTDLIPKGGVNLDRLFDIGIQLTDALAAAHARGITHRDLKPSNIIIGKDNNLKVLDFGLAKLREPEPEPEEGDSAASTELLTQEGGLLGTVPYMSPEQVQGKPADERSDIFSCGVILYQLAIGQRPFDGDSSADLMSSIIRDDPPSVDTKKAGLPHHLSRIIKRALEKDPEHRYQSAKDLRNSLADLRQELSEDGSDTPPVPRPRPRLLKLVISLAALAAVSIGVLAWRLIDGPLGTVTPDRPPLPQARSFQVTSAPGWESDVAISPDGTLLAYASNEWGDSDIWLVDATGGTPIQLTKHPASDTKPAWFPDDTAIAFQSERGGQTAIWKVPRLGGSPTMLLADARDPAISPDGTHIAFSRITPGGNSRIATAEISNPDSVSTLTGSDDGMWGHRDPAWSPDGQQLCYTDFGDLWIVPSIGGEARKLTAAGAADREPVWSPGGRFVYFSSYREGPLALWRVEVATGETERITMGTGPESQPSISSNGSRLAYSTFHQDPDVVLRDLDSGDEARIPGTRSEWGPAVAPDRSAVVYVSNRDGYDSLWRQDLEGLNALGQAVRLSDEDAEPSNPDFSPDGMWIAYQRKVESTRNIWTLLAESGLPRPFTDGEGIRYQPAWSPDGSRIAYIADDDGRTGLWVMPFEDGRSTGPARRIEIGVEALWWPRWSPDGTRIAYTGAVDAVWDVWISLADNSQPPRRLTHGAHANYLRWSDAGNGLLVSGRWDGRVLSLRRVDPITGRSSPFEPPLDFGLALHGVFDIGAAGTLLAFTRETVRGDLWLLETHEGAY